MAFLEQIGRSISGAGYKVSKLTENVADLAAFNSAAAESRKQLQQLYAELGEAYYLRHQSDGAAEEREKIARITSLKNELAEYEEKLRQTRNVVRCPGCGRELPADAGFCQYCGRRLTPEQAGTFSAGARCPACGSPVAAGSAFCTNCGKKIQQG